MKELIHKLFSADSIDQICQAFVSTNGYDTKAIGAIYCDFSDSAEFSVEGSFGKEIEKLKLIASELDSKHLLHTISEATIFMPVEEAFFILCIPAIYKGTPVGVLFLAGRSLGDSQFELIPALNDVTSKSLGLLVSKIHGRNEFQLHHEETRKEKLPLSPRQLRILGLITDGFTNAEIAELLFLSPSTVRHETIKIYSYLGVPSRKRAVEAAKSQGMVS